MKLKNVNELTRISVALNSRGKHYNNQIYILIRRTLC